MGLITLTSELDAVNTMLALIGERPLNSLDNLQRAKAIAAVKDLERITKRILMEGWWFNRFENQEILPILGKYEIPENWTGVDTHLPSSTSTFAVRNGFLYDLKTRTDSGFTATLKIDYIELLEWDQLPHAAREFLSTAAAVLFVGSQLGSKAVLDETRENAAQAQETIEREELRHIDANLQNQPEVNRVMRRRR